MDHDPSGLAVGLLSFWSGWPDLECRLVSTCDQQSGRPPPCLGGRTALHPAMTTVHLTHTHDPVGSLLSCAGILGPPLRPFLHELDLVHLSYLAANVLGAGAGILA